MNNPIRVTLLSYPNICLFEFATAHEIFGQDRPEFAQQHYSLGVCDITNENSNAWQQTNVSITSVSLEELAKADLIIVPGWQGANTKPSNELAEQLKLAHERGAIIASICSGAFLLGHCGLLDNKRATTHWRYIDSAQEMFPKAHFDQAVLYTEDKQIMCSAGSAAGIDMCLAIVRKHYGQAVANTYSRRLVVPPHRDGGQAQFIQPYVQPTANNNPFEKLTEELQHHLDKSYSVQKMADIACMSERHFQRQFKAYFNCSPAKWLINLRMQRSCELLETTHLPLKKIAQLSGLGSEETLRHHFREILKTSPSDYRKTFAGNF